MLTAPEPKTPVATRRHALQVPGLAGRTLTCPAASTPPATALQSTLPPGNAGDADDDGNANLAPPTLTFNQKAREV